MESLLRQSRSMCPFLNKTSPATLRSLSTTTRHVSPGGGTMSNLQVLARRCPVMGKAMAVQSGKTSNNPLNGVFGGVRAYGGKAKMHTSRTRNAQVAPDVLKNENSRMSYHLDRFFYNITHNSSSANRSYAKAYDFCPS